MRNEAKKNARIRRGVYKCNACARELRPAEIEIDHINPVTPISGFDSWDGYIKRLFCDPTELNVLCKACHSVKTKKENQARKESKSLGKV